MFYPKQLEKEEKTPHVQITGSGASWQMSSTICEKIKQVIGGS